MKNIQNYTKDILLILLGCILEGIGLNLFIIPNKMLSGGLSGISIILNYLTQMNIGLIMFLLNIPIFLLAYKKLDKNFVILSIIGTIGLSISIDLIKPISTITSFKINDILLCSIFGGVINGFANGLIFRGKGSTGGLDIISIVLKKKCGINVSTMSFIMNIFIVFMGMTIGGFQIGLYTLISMFICARTINFTIDGLDRKKALFIVTEKEENVSQAIIKELGRGVTFFYGQGAYTKKDKKVIYCIVSLSQVVKIKEKIEEIDENSFIAILDTAEVQGKGFKRKTI